VTSVDVVIPTYKETRRLFRAVNSAKSQTYPISTIWVIDDGSEQSVVDEMERHFLGDKQIVFKSVSHTGLPGKLRELAVKESEAEWIAFLDADDYWIDQKIANQLLLAQHQQSDLVHSNAIKVSHSEKNLYFSNDQFNSSPTFYDLVSDNKLINSSVMVRRKKLLEIGTYCSSSNLRAVEDYATWLRLSTRVKISGSYTPLVVYEVSPEGLSAEDSSDRRIIALEDFLTWSRALPTQGLLARCKSALQRFFVLLQICKERIK